MFAEIESLSRAQASVGVSGARHARACPVRAPSRDDRSSAAAGSTGHARRCSGCSPRSSASAPTSATAMILGESGSGKELVARRIHELSARSAHPFVAVNCGALPETLIESELFGHERGAFTGAARTHHGCFERADKGTLLLDEIAEMPADMQVRLLRVLESGRFTRVGGSQEIAADVRVLAATNRALDAAVADGKLREDLMYRLCVIPVEVPPLRERDGDALLLAEMFLQEHNREHGTDKRFSRASRERIAAHPWPGNVRELRNVVYRAFVLCDGEVDVGRSDARAFAGAPARRRPPTRGPRGRSPCPSARRSTKPNGR